MLGHFCSMQQLGCSSGYDKVGMAGKPGNTGGPESLPGHVTAELAGIAASAAAKG